MSLRGAANSDERSVELIATFAAVTTGMMTLHGELSSNAAITSARRGCDVRQYRDFMTEKAKYCFESYVEADTLSGETFVWLFDITVLSTRWSIHRAIAKQVAEGQDVIQAFDEATFQSTDQLVDGFPALAAEFFDSAKTIKFDT